MKIAVAGATGFVGEPLVRALLDDGHQVIAIGRSRGRITRRFGTNVDKLKWDDFKTNEAKYMLEDVDVIINLAGAGIADKRWTDERKKVILESRLETTGLLAKYLSENFEKKKTLLNASAIGIYGTQQPVKNDLPPGLKEGDENVIERNTNFLSEVCDQWEVATQPAKDAGHRVVLMRVGVVLGKDGGALQKMALPFHLFAGGPIGNGNQPLPWISRHDLVKSMIYCAKNTDLKGAVNLVSPLCVTNKQFAKTLGKVLKRPGFIPTPGFVLKIVVGEMANDMILKGVHVVPGVLRDSGFQFDHPDLETALRYIYQK